MKNSFVNALQSLGRELSLLIASLDANLAVLSQIVSPLLAGEEPTLLAEEVEFGQALDEAIDHATRVAIEVIEALELQRPLMNAAQGAELTQANARLEALVNRWKELMEAVNDVWYLGKPPN